MDVGLLILRLLLGAILFGHATQKLFGWFHGGGVDGSAALFADLGVRPARPMVLVAATSELTGAALLAAGLAAPLGATITAGTMLVAGMCLSLASGKFWNAAGGGEYPLVLAAVAVGLGFTGPGVYSLDHLLDLPWANSEETTAVLTGSLVAILAVAAATPPTRQVRRFHSRRRVELDH